MSSSSSSPGIIKLSPESGNSWWFYSELTYSSNLIDLPPAPTRNVIQWIPFGTHDVSELERAHQAYQNKKKANVSSTKSKPEHNNNTDPLLGGEELSQPDRFVKVKNDTRQYLKVDLERMRMGPIYWQGEEYFIRRSTWFLVPEGSKITEGFPVERGLQSLLTERYEETLNWIDKSNDYSGFEEPVYEDIIVEKIVPLIPEEDTVNSASSNNSNRTTTPPPPPLIQVHDPQAPDISRYFLVFRQGCNDYARLCVEKKTKGRSRDSKGGSPVLEGTTNAKSTLTVPYPHTSTTTHQHLSSHTTQVPDAPAVLPLESENPIPGRSVSSGDLSAAESLREEGATSPVSSNHSNSASAAMTNGYHSFRLYRTYASFYHALANNGNDKRGNSSSSSNNRVQTQTQTRNLQESSLKEDINNNSSSNNKNKKTSKDSSNTNYNTSSSTTPLSPGGNITNNPALDAAVRWKSIRVQSHSFKGHPLPSPEIPCDLGPSSPARYVIFVVHGVGQRAFRKMGFHFNKDCDEMRNVLLDAAQLRGLSPGSTVVLPVSWRAELNLAGNFTFGDESETEDESCACEEMMNNGKTSNTNDNVNIIDQDLKDLTESFNSKLDETSRTFQRAVSVFEGQFTEILERLALESIPAVRSVLSDATMDILLYVSQKHFNKILSAVIREVIRLHRLFSHWNPEFKGEFSFVAHSLGSALVADLLSFTAVPDEVISLFDAVDDDDMRTSEAFMKAAEGHEFPFKIDKFFAMGSPLGVFHLLKHTKPIGCIRSRHIETALENRIRKWRMARNRPGGREITDVPSWSVYNCKQFYNVFHPHDPVAHRFESLTLPRGGVLVEEMRRGSTVEGKRTSRSSSSSSSAASLLPAPLKIPYHKSGLTRFKMDLEAKIARAKDDWSKLTIRLPTWLGGNSTTTTTTSSSSSTSSKDENNTDDSSSIIAQSTDTSSTQNTPRNDNPLAAFNQNFCRVDFSLQDSVMENPYISALGAHFVYWSDLDIAAFIVSELIKN